MAVVVTIAGKRYVSGLSWALLHRNRSFDREARQIAAREKFDAIALRKAGGTRQVGLGHAAEIGSKPAYSLALELIHALGDSFLAAFDLGNDVYAMVAAKDGGVLPGFDLCGPRELIEARFSEAYTGFGIEKNCVCPKDFGFAGREADLASVLSKKPRSDSRIVLLRRGGGARLALAIAAVLLLIAAAFGAWLYAEKQAETEEELQAQMRAAAEAAAQAVGQTLPGTAAPAVQPLPHPWASQPKPVAFLEACLPALWDLPLSVGGWEITTASCSGASVTATYLRKGVATPATFRSVAEARGMAVSAIEVGETATVTRALSELAAGGDDPMAPLDPIAEQVRGVLKARKVDHDLQLKAPPVPPQPAGGAGGPADPAEPDPAAPPPPDWRTYTLSMTSRLSPDMTLSGLTEIPAFRIQSIQVKREGSRLTWSTTGELHGK